MFTYVNKCTEKIATFSAAELNTLGTQVMEEKLADLPGAST